MNRFTIVLFLLIFSITHSLSQSIHKYSDIFFLDDHHGWILSNNGYLWKTTNAGTDWMRIYDSRIDTSGQILFVDEQNGWMLLNTSLFSSNDGGYNWQFLYEFSSFSGQYDFTFVNNSTGFVSNTNKLYKTIDGGLSWQTLTDTLGVIRNISAYGENLLFVSSSRYPLVFLFKSTNQGESWSVSKEFGSLDYSEFGSVQMLNQNEGILFFGYTYIVFVGKLLRTTNGGDSWVDFGNGFVFSFGLTDFKFISLQEGWATNNSRQIFKTTNGGELWDTLHAQQNEVPHKFKFFNSNNSYGITQNHIYHTFDGWVTYYIADSVVTGIEERINNPSGYFLEQNYPNPFNPSTNIKYEIAQREKVSLKVYDALGKEVATLVNDFQSAGKYSLNFTANPLMSSGIYFYQLKAGSFLETKKMLLIK